MAFNIYGGIFGCNNSGLRNNKPTLLDCDSLISKMEYLKTQFDTNKPLKASDLDLLIDIIYSLDQCNDDENSSQNNSFEQNNLLKIINLSNINNENQISNHINSLSQFEVLETEIAIFKVYIDNILHIYGLNLGKGTYGQGSGVTIQLSDLTLIYKQTKIKEDLIYVTLSDLGATSFDDNLPQLIKDYAIANSITKEDESLHSWIVEEDVRPFEIMSNGVTLRLKTELGFGEGTTGLADNDTSGTIYEAVDTAGLYNLPDNSAEKYLNDPSTQIIELGDITNTTIENAVNSLDPNITIQSAYQGPHVFTTTINGEVKNYKISPFLLVSSKVVGVGSGNTMTSSDFSTFRKKPFYQYCTTLVDDMSGLFSLSYSEIRQEIDYLDENLSNWDTSNVLNMAGMFRGQNVFNNNNNIDTGMPGLNSVSNTGVIGIDNWDVSKVTNMSEMFSNDFYSSVYPDITTPPFNQPLNNWNVSSVTNMSDMFLNSQLFNQSLDNWDVSSVTNMSGIFLNAEVFNQPLNTWNVSNVTDMSDMFNSAEAFNQALDSWDVSNVTNMSLMFRSAILFNQPLNVWNVTNVTNMYGMFWRAEAFNQPLNTWNVSNVTDMDYMFLSADLFNQDLTGWCVTNITTEPNNFAGPILSTANKPIWGTCP